MITERPTLGSGHPKPKKTWACCEGTQRLVGETGEKAMTTPQVKVKWSVDHSGFTWENKPCGVRRGEFNPGNWFTPVGGVAENTAPCGVQ